MVGVSTKGPLSSMNEGGARMPKREEEGQSMQDTQPSTSVPSRAI